MQTEDQAFAAPAGSGQDRPFSPGAITASRDRSTEKSCSKSGANAPNPFIANTNPQKLRSETVKNVHAFNNCPAALPNRFFPAPNMVQMRRTRLSPTQISENRGPKRSKTFCSLTIAPNLVANSQKRVANGNSFAFTYGGTGSDMLLP
jgi:hypothetical protein